MSSYLGSLMVHQSGVRDGLKLPGISAPTSVRRDSVGVGAQRLADDFQIRSIGHFVVAADRRCF